MFCQWIQVLKRSIYNDCSLKFIDTAELCKDEIYKILWICLDLKAHVKNNQNHRKLLQGKRVTMLCSQSQCTNLIVQSAIQNLGADLKTMMATKWETSIFKRDIGRFYSLFSDVILAQGESHSSLCELSEGAWVPVVNLSSHKFVPLHGLAVLTTLQEHFGRLAGLTVGWVGPMGSKLNTLIYLLPKVGVNLRYNSTPQPNFPASPLILPKGRSLCEAFKTRIETCSDLNETITGADVVATSKHRTNTQTIELEMLEQANKSWVFLHLLPRWRGDVTEQVFNHKNSLVWKLHDNIQYTTMAVILHLFQKYQPVTLKPDFG